jgi:hypothetical protein
MERWNTTPEFALVLLLSFWAITLHHPKHVLEISPSARTFEDYDLTLRSLRFIPPQAEELPHPGVNNCVLQTPKFPAGDHLQMFFRWRYPAIFIDPCGSRFEAHDQEIEA